MPEIQIVKVDQGAVNARILAKEAKADFRRVEAASLKILARFTSAEGKRFVARLFNTLQLNAHFISVISRTRLDHDDVARIEDAIRTRMEAASTALNQAIDGAEALFKVHGITCAATYDAVPLDIEVHVLSSLGRRYLEVLGKLDQLMPLLQTLEIHEVLSTQEVDIQRANLKRQVRDIANGTRTLAMGLRRQMNTMAEKAGDKQPPSEPADPDKPAANSEATAIVSAVDGDHEEDGQPAPEIVAVPAAESES